MNWSDGTILEAFEDLAREDDPFPKARAAALAAAATAFFHDYRSRQGGAHV
jgi:hypothetical protein